LNFTQGSMNFASLLSNG